MLSRWQAAGPNARRSSATDTVLDAISRALRPNHLLVGQMTFTYETMEIAADEGLFLIACGAAPGSRDADALNLLASWSATQGIVQAGADDGVGMPNADGARPR